MDKKTDTRTLEGEFKQKDIKYKYTDDNQKYFDSWKKSKEEFLDKIISSTKEDAISSLKIAIMSSYKHFMKKPNFSKTNKTKYPSMQELLDYNEKIINNLSDDELIYYNLFEENMLDYQYIFEDDKNKKKLLFGFFWDMDGKFIIVKR